MFAPNFRLENQSIRINQSYHFKIMTERFVVRHISPLYLGFHQLVLAGVLYYYSE